MYCQGSSSQIKSITQPLPLLGSQKGSLGTCMHVPRLPFCSKQLAIHQKQPIYYLNFLRSTADLAGFLVGNDLAFIWHRISFDFRRLTKIIFYWTKFGKSVHCARRRERVICQNVARLACHLFCSELTLTTTSTVLHEVIKKLN